VRAVVRSHSKESQVLSDFPGFAARLDFGVVPDITLAGAFDQVVQAEPPFEIVIHTASPFLCKIARPMISKCFSVLNAKES